MADMARHKRGKGRSRVLQNKRVRNKPRHRGERVPIHFSPQDFKCQHPECDCKRRVKVSLGLIGGLELLRQKCGKRVHIVKGFECPERAPKSLYKNYHLTGIAAEIKVKDMSAKDVFLIAETIDEFQGLAIDFDRDVVYVDTRKENAQKWVFQGENRIELTDENRVQYFGEPDETKPDSESKGTSNQR